MTRLLRLSLLALVVTLTAGPLLAAPVSLTAGPTLTAPHSAPTPAPRFGWRAFALLGSLAVGIAVKDTGTIASKYVTRASAASGDYKAGVQGAGGAWESGAKNGEQNYVQGVQEAIGDGRFGKGVSGKASKYQTNAVNLGSTRYAPGVQNAQSAYSAGVQPYLDKLKSLTLPPKGPRRSPQNMQRANVVATELGKLKTGK